MPLREEFARHGEFLFRWRSYLPVLILPLFALALPQSGHGQRIFGNGFDLFIEVLSIMVAFSGLILRGLTVGYVASGTSGRNTRRQRAATLNTTGMYSIVRHPLYLGNFIVLLGGLLFLQVWWFAAIVILAYWLYYERIMFREEEFLRDRFQIVYLEWAHKTPAFLPLLSGWRPTARQFSWRTVFRREYTGILWVTGTFALLEFAQDAIVMGRKDIDEPFIYLFGVSFIAYIILRTLKRRTTILRVRQ